MKYALLFIYLYCQFFLYINFLIFISTYSIYNYSIFFQKNQQMIRTSILVASLFAFVQPTSRLLQNEWSWQAQVVPPEFKNENIFPAKNTYDPTIVQYDTSDLPTQKKIKDPYFIPLISPLQVGPKTINNFNVNYPQKSVNYQIVPNQNDQRVVQRVSQNNYVVPSKTNQQINSYVTPSYSYGSSSDNQKTRTLNDDCILPRVYIGGICRCPKDGVYVAGICFKRQDSPPSNCNPPREIINGECICPNNRIYTSGNSCVGQDTIQFIESEETKCKFPRRLTLNGYCLCPNNGEYISGECLATYHPRSEYEPYYQPIDFDSIANLGKIFRQYNGTNNNLQNKNWGSKGSILQRRTKANYEDGTDTPFSYLPNPRQISNYLSQIQFEDIPKSRNKVTSVTTFFGQFLDHDLDLTQFGQSQKMDIKIPFKDKFFTKQQNIPFTRSGFVKINNVRMHKNLITSWIDGSQIYGSDQQTAKSLRSFTKGKLKVSVDNMLPREDKLGLFLAGDIRANENIMLTGYHVVFLRQHNRICQQISRSHPQMNDEAIFRSARQWIIGLFQKITLQEFVPILLGDQYEKIIGRYNGYRSNVNPNIPTQFSTAAFRVGHSLLLDFFTFINNKGEAYQNKRLSDLFLNPKYVTSELVQDAFRGLSKTLIKQKSIKLSSSVRNLLILNPNNRSTKLDLFSLNLQRSRDHGLPTYNQARVSYGLNKVSNFEQIDLDFERARKLREIYKGKIDDVELFVGILSEQPVKNGILGELGCKIVGQTFRNLRDGDRFWYESAYPARVVKQIKQTTLSDLIRRNTNIGYVPDDIWHYYE